MFIFIHQTGSNINNDTNNRKLNCNERKEGYVGAGVDEYVSQTTLGH